MANHQLDYYIHDEATAFRFKLIGVLNADEAAELERCWQTASSVFASKTRLVDVNFVTAIDDTGRRLLRRWYEEGARFVAQSAGARLLVESITGHALPVARTVPRSVKWLPFLLLLLVRPPVSPAGELRPEAVQAWDEYVHAAEARLQQRVRHGRSIFWMDESPEMRQRVRAGEILVSSVGSHNPHRVPGGLIHDWVGATFIPDTNVAKVLGVVRDYSRYKQFYRPVVMDAKPLRRDGAQDLFSLLLVNDEFLLKVALNGEYTASYCQIDEKRWYGVNRATRIQEIRDYGQTSERSLEPGEGSGYIWRTYGVSKFEERDGGVYVELEAIVLSRDIPASLRWLADPIVRRVSRNSLTISLRQTSEAVRSSGDLETRARR